RVVPGVAVVTAGLVARVGVVGRRRAVVPAVGVRAVPAARVVLAVPADPMVTVVRQAPVVPVPVIPVVPRVPEAPLIPVPAVPAVTAPVCGHVGDDTPQGYSPRWCFPHVDHPGRRSVPVPRRPLVRFRAGRGAPAHRSLGEPRHTCRTRTTLDS